MNPFAGGWRIPVRDEKGVALVSLLVILAALTVLSMGLIVFSSTELRIADNQKNHTNALFVTEAGIQEVVSRMELDPGTNVTVNGATFDPYIGDDAANPDPNWRTELYLAPSASLPAPVGTEIIVPTAQSSANWLTYADPAQGLQPIVVEHKWIDRNADGVRDLNELVRYDGSQFPPENFDMGQLIEVITASGIVNGAQRQVRAEIVHIPITVGVNAAITCDNGVDLTGNMTGCGHNHEMTTPTGTQIPGCYPHEECNNRTLCASGGCLVSVMTTGDEADTGGSSDLEGFPAWSDTSSANSFNEVWEYLGISETQWDFIRNNPDYTSANDAINMAGIAIINGDAVSGEKFNGNVGEGLIYVNGDMDISGNFVWRGFIYVEGDCVITGTAWILGAICVRGTTTDDAFSAGNSTILYSRDTIAQNVGGQLGFKTLAWNEQ
jgi:hypothetical protein